MRPFILLFLSVASFSFFVDSASAKPAGNQQVTEKRSKGEYGFTDAARYGFSAGATGIVNTRALQKAVDQTGTIVVSKPGIYKMAGTVFIGSNTSLIFGNNVILKKVDEQGVFSHILVNKGAASKKWDHHIAIEGLQIMVNGMDVRTFREAYGLHGQLAFFYVRDLKIDHFRCFDLGKAQYGIHICTFEDIVVHDVMIKGDKDGIHLGRGKRFTISNGVFQTYDDAIALNGHDYAVGNPELGWIEDGVVENCHDLEDGKKPVGYFCRILGGGWTDWQPGMEVQQSDAVVSNGNIYRVQAKPDGTLYKSLTAPSHDAGNQVLDGINWGMVQHDAIYTAGVRNVVFRDIFLHKPRIGFSIHFDNDRFSRSYYPGAPIPQQENILLDNIRVLYEEPTDLISVNTPVDILTIANSSLRAGGISFHGNKALTDYLPTQINICGSAFNAEGAFVLVKNSVENKEIRLVTSSNIWKNDGFSALLEPGKGKFSVKSDLPGLNESK